MCTAPGWREQRFAGAGAARRRVVFNSAVGLWLWTVRHSRGGDGRLTVVSVSTDNQFKTSTGAEGCSGIHLPWLNRLLFMEFAIWFIFLMAHQWTEPYLEVHRLVSHFK